MEQLDYISCSWLWDFRRRPIGTDDFTKNRDRLQTGAVCKFMSKLLNHPEVKPLLSDEHFSVDGTLIEAWASHRVRPKDGSGDDDGGADFHGQQRKNDTHASPAIPTAVSTARPPGGRQSSTWATPPWRTGMGWRWPAWSRSPMALPSAAPRRSCSRPKPGRPAAASRWAKIRPMTRLTMWPICAPSMLRRM